jgi:hypothetical protein
MLPMYRWMVCVADYVIHRSRRSLTNQGRLRMRRKFFIRASSRRNASSGSPG